MSVIIKSYERIGYYSIQSFQKICQRFRNARMEGICRELSAFDERLCKNLARNLIEIEFKCLTE